MNIVSHRLYGQIKSGLWDAPRSGRPSIFAIETKNKALKLTLENPCSLKAGVQLIAEKFGVEISAHTLKQPLKSKGHIWKWLRRSLRDKRN